MIKTFTQDDLIRYVYHETTEQETKEIEQALICDAQLQEAYNKLTAIQNQLDSAVYNPSDKVVSKVLNYAKK